MWNKLRGFTLIELLIVIAIILILIAIALPNFLEAQVRARVTQAEGNLRTMEIAVNEHRIDYGTLYADYNDPLNVKLETRCKKQPGLCPVNYIDPFPTGGGLTFLGGEGMRYAFYGLWLHCPLTTPVKYIDPNQTIDPFSDGTVPVGYDSRYIDYDNTGKSMNKIVYGVFVISGPDLVAGDWNRGYSPTGMAIPYSPTNGTKSRGEFWRVISEYSNWAKAEYPILSH